MSKAWSKAVQAIFEELMPTLYKISLVLDQLSPEVRKHIKKCKLCQRKLELIILCFTENCEHVGKLRVSI